MDEDDCGRVLSTSSHSQELQSGRHRMVRIVLCDSGGDWGVSGYVLGPFIVLISLKCGPENENT